MTGSLRSRLFVSILATVLVAVAVSLAIGVALTRSAVRSSFADQLSQAADLFATAATSAPQPGAGIAFLQALPPRSAGQPPPLPVGGGVSRAGGGTKRGEVPVSPPGVTAFSAPAGGPPPEGPMPRVLSLAEARALLPVSAVSDLEADGEADGRADIDGSDQLFAARTIDVPGAGDAAGTVLLLSRSAAVGGSDFNPYLGGLLLASGLAGLLAAVAAGLIARALSAPLRRASVASAELAGGRRPDELPEEGPTELVTLARSFNQMASRLERAREAERSVLMSVSHELRTPLTAIRGYAEGIEDDAVDPADAAPVIAAEAGRLERLVQDLLALARLDQGVLEFRREQIDLAAVARDARARLALEADERRVEVIVDANGSAAAVADRDRVLQAISNLIENAIRATPPDGRVSVGVSPGLVRVSDTGPGIPAEDVPHAFERFHLRARADSSGDGAGIGLAIVRELVEGMGGGVELRSEPGQGAEFTVTLPTV